MICSTPCAAAHRAVPRGRRRGGHRAAPRALEKPLADSKTNQFENEGRAGDEQERSTGQERRRRGAE
eukprot:2573479-Pyramimonas_sp.AAC.1